MNSNGFRKTAFRQKIKNHVELIAVTSDGIIKARLFFSIVF